MYDTHLNIIIVSYDIVVYSIPEYQRVDRLFLDFSSSSSSSSSSLTWNVAIYLNSNSFGNWLTAIHSYTINGPPYSGRSFTIDYRVLHIQIYT